VAPCPPRVGSTAVVALSNSAQRSAAQRWASVPAKWKPASSLPRRRLVRCEVERHPGVPRGHERRLERRDTRVHRCELARRRRLVKGARRRREPDVSGVYASIDRGANDSRPQRPDAGDIVLGWRRQAQLSRVSRRPQPRARPLLHEVSEEQIGAVLFVACDRAEARCPPTSAVCAPPRHGSPLTT
jgi:hypothetical protein